MEQGSYSRILCSPHHQKLVHPICTHGTPPERRDCLRTSPSRGPPSHRRTHGWIRYQAHENVSGSTGGNAFEPPEACDRRNGLFLCSLLVLLSRLQRFPTLAMLGSSGHPTQLTWWANVDEWCYGLPPWHPGCHHLGIGYDGTAICTCGQITAIFRIAGPPSSPLITRTSAKSNAICRAVATATTKMATKAVTTKPKTIKTAATATAMDAAATLTATVVPIHLITAIMVRAAQSSLRTPCWNGKDLGVYPLSPVENAKSPNLMAQPPKSLCASSGDICEGREQFISWVHSTPNVEFNTRHNPNTQANSQIRHNSGNQNGN